jgi:excisionase family DNA binding protein
MSGRRTHDAAPRPAVSLKARSNPNGDLAEGVLESPPAASQLLVAEEVAHLLSVPVSWVREATRAGRLPHIRLGRYVRYESESLTAWLGDQQSHGGGLA